MTTFGTVAAKRVDFSYDTASQLNQITRYEDLAGTKLVATSSFVFDLSGRLTDLTHQQNATVFADYDWDYDAANRLEQFVSSLDGTVDYNYDARDQLTAATYVGQASSLPSDESYTYDDNGNRVLANGATYQTDPNNRLVNDGTYTYLYDDEGNLTKRMKTSDGSYTVYSWDHRNRLTKIADKTSLNVVTKEVTYQYDVFDRRIAKAIDTPASGLQSQVYIYDGAHIAMTLSYNAVSEEYELTNRYLHGPAVDMILADEQISDPAQEGNTLWPLTDNLGSVRDIADYDATTDITSIANRIVYDSFGNIASETNAAVDHVFGYTGRECDEESDFYFYRGRYYDPKTGRFASEDPIGFGAGDPNLNRYVGNNATGAVDPSGLVTGQLAGGSNVVDATGNPTGNGDCGGYVGGGGEEDYGSGCSVTENSGYGTEWFNNDWTDWINPFAYIAEHGYSQGDRIGTGGGALLYTDLSATAAFGRLRQKRLVEEALDMDSRKDREYFANELRQTIGNGLNELGETAYQVADGALASAELASEVAMLAEAGAPSAGSILRSATTRMSGSAVKQSAAGAARAAEFSHNWQRASLQKAIQRHAGPDATSWTTKTGKTIIENPSTGRQVVVDNAGGYFRIYQPRTIGATKGKYLDMLGKTPAPARYVKNGAVKNIELGADALESATHFLIQ